MEMLKMAALTMMVTSPLFLTGCPNDNDNDSGVVTSVMYEVELTNLTAAQPMSPMAVVLHGSGYKMWTVGTSASNGLEQLAESGDNTEILAEAAGENGTTMSGGGVITPGASESVTIEADGAGDLALSLATMLVNTNDAYTGVDSKSLSEMRLDETQTMVLTAYDAGTEANSELASTIPGPAAGGEGFNATRDDRDSVGGHPGVVTHDDGLNSSALGEEHRFDNPVARVTITRLQ
ncbi:MAG: spondin domain-containing protein [Candidatus Thiodiazotropha sp.]|nr:spondin domain-containing protein [Candidatus Thiodiazotropha sp.]MCM8885178.1 spondin domain-containing protein [Candidatus Thiodiazotropha sp.]MCM8921524.1 spondin domain-containing protein [Candidatus Thiodiazotropha sp.]